MRRLLRDIRALLQLLLEQGATDDIAVKASLAEKGKNV